MLSHQAAAGDSVRANERVWGGGARKSSLPDTAVDKLPLLAENPNDEQVESSATDDVQSRRAVADFSIPLSALLAMTVGCLCDGSHISRKDTRREAISESASAPSAALSGSTMGRRSSAFSGRVASLVARGDIWGDGIPKSPQNECRLALLTAACSGVER